MRPQILKQIYKDAIRTDFDLLHKICKANKGHKGRPVSYRTLEVWLRTDSDRLTSATTLKVIKEHMGLNEFEELTESKEEIAETV
jgi:hypothetical protein